MVRTYVCPGVTRVENITSLFLLENLFDQMRVD